MTGLPVSLMILYDPNELQGFFEFGIQIPISDSKAARTFDVLRQDPQLGPRIREWHIPRVDEPLSREDLLRAHGHGYVNRLFANTLEEEILRTYELIDDQGRYYRYAPDQATLPLRDLFTRILKRVAGTAQCCRIAMEAGEEGRYNDRLKDGLEQLEGLSVPDLAVIVSGADPYFRDTLPSTQGLKLTQRQLLARDCTIYRFLKKRRIPQAGLMAGGYGPHVWEVYAGFLVWALRARLLAAVR